ncbi:hypothetical protein ASD52_36405 [Ensifer sp. Root142]|uniref:hypothetical protein n=1 Tax=Ensifer sp. Root142 TaxID=1736461 RepID=UPI00070D96C8|nr:hypothetical protein [Ensifer sp. Root142]KQY62737.1 hypothetical protein ASD52_36405 [Ensifer sp. Root142]
MQRRNVLVIIIAAAFSALCNAQAGHAACPPLPHQIANGQVADATKLMENFGAVRDCASAPGGMPNAIQYNDGNGGFGGIGPLTDGQLIVGNSNGVAQATALTAGPGIVITNGPGTVMIGSAQTSSFQRESGPYAPPNASSFTAIDTPASIVPTVSNVANVGMVYSVPITSNTTAFPAAYRPVPQNATWTLTFRAKYSVLMGSYPEFGVWLKDSAGKMLGAVMESRSSSASLVVKRCNSNTQVNANVYTQAVSDPPNWFRVRYDGQNIEFAFSWDGQNWLIVWSEAKNAFLDGSLQLVGIGGLSGISNASMWQPGSTMGGIVTYWDIDDDPAATRAVQ